MDLHTFEEALAIARAIQATPDADLKRAATGLSLKAILSLAALAHDLDELARAAAAVPMSLDQAAFVMAPGDFALFADLRSRLVEAGYLNPENEEADNGQS